MQMLKGSSVRSGKILWNIVILCAGLGELRYDAHPMAILTSAFAYLGSYYAEANPSLQGQSLFTKGDAESLAVMDKQIFRLIGKATTLAA